MKSSADFLKEANAVVPKISIQDAIAKVDNDDVVFLDVRDSSDVNKTGTIKNALKIPRGLIEFAADDQCPFYNDKLNKEKQIILVCAAGGQAALTGKTLKDMGYNSVFNVGGISDWINSGGPTE